MRTVLTALALALFIFVAPALLASPLTDLDAAMAPIAQKLITVDEALAADSTEGVQAAAEAIALLAAEVKTDALTGADADKLKGLEGKILPAARALAQASSLEAQRAALKDLSKPIALWATVRQPEGIFVAYCPMAKASWLQDEAMISNPYYGASMLRCGEVVKRSDGAKPGAADPAQGDGDKGHAGHGH